MKYWVYTPPYSQGGGFYNAPEYGADVVQVEALTKRQAIRAGLRELRRLRSQWVRDMESDHRCPLNGLMADTDEENQQ